jgi:outer membrane protein assembly factor BamD (BamD/ComL family)
MNMKRFLIISLILVSAACQSRKYRAPENPDFLFGQAMELFQNRKFTKSAELFRSFVFKYPLSDSVDDAQYYLAKSYKEAKQYDDAIVEYTFLITTFPASGYAGDAYLELAECYLNKSKNVARDTESLSEAKRYLGEFKVRFPNSSLMDKAREIELRILRLSGFKYIYIADTYLRIGEPKSADVYLNIAMQEFGNDDSIAVFAKILSARSLVMKGDCHAAKAIIEELEQSKSYNDLGLKKQFNIAKKELSKKCKE